MASRLSPRNKPAVSGCVRFLLRKSIALLFLLLALGISIASAQTTTISGTVFDPRTTANSLPLPNVLVYITVDPVPPLPSGVQCLTYQAPAGAISYTYTAADGTFSLDKVPVNSTYTLVIQAGKWRRQFNQPVITTPVTGLALHMPSDHTQGDIPMIAIATGSVDAAECVLLDMGVSSSEFTDDNASVNPGGHIHLYKGSGGPGAQINASTPSQSSLMSSASTMNGYDMLMFPCQGQSAGQANATAAANLFNFANAGGRVFTTHFSYVWLVPDAPFNSQFPPVANWTYTTALQIGAGTGTVANNFSDGAVLAQWLQNAGATAAGSPNQIDIGTLRTDVASVIAPTQSWVTLNNGTYNGANISNNPVMQMTFNTPVGAPAANQCGRVMFNDYHVFNVSDPGQAFPAECPDPATHVMSAQEKMLEFALFDLSAFVQPVVVPTLNVTVDPNPIIVKPNDSGVQVNVSVTNTSTTTSISSSTILTFTLPQLLTVSSINDPSGAWSCNAASLTCTRTNGLAAGATNSVTLTLNVGTYPAGGLASYTGQITATVSSVTFSTNVVATGGVIYQKPPTITWIPPDPIVYGAAIGPVQLNATADTPGSFTYNPPAGTVLNAGSQTLTANFVPADTTHYMAGTASVPFTVLAVTPSIGISASRNTTFLTSSITFTANVPIPSASAAGTVTFYDGSAPIGSSPLTNGTASATTSSLSAGTHTITAAFSGNSNYGPANSSPVVVNVEDFTLALSGGGAATVLPSGQATFTLTVTPVGGSTLPGAITLSNGSLPVGSSATLSSSSIAANSPATSVTLQVRLAGSATASLDRKFGQQALPFVLALMILPFGFKTRRLTSWFLLAIITAALATGLTACGGAALAPRTFSFPVNAVSGGLSHSATVNITIQNSTH